MLSHRFLPSCYRITTRFSPPLFFRRRFLSSPNRPFSNPILACATFGKENSTALLTDEISKFDQRITWNEASPQQKVDYTTLHASIAELQSWLPSRIEQVVQWHEQSVALKLRNERSMTWMYLSWHPEAARVTCGSQLKRGAVSEAYTFGAALNRLLNGRILTTATLPIPFERVVQLSFSESLNKERKQDLWCEIMGKRSNVILTDKDGKIQLCAQQIGVKHSSVRQIQIGKLYQLPPVGDRIRPDVVKTAMEFKEALTNVPNSEDVSLASLLVLCFQGISPSLARDFLQKLKIDVSLSLKEMTDPLFDALFFEWQSWLQRLEHNTFAFTFDEAAQQYSVIGLPGIQFESIHALLDECYRSFEIELDTERTTNSLRHTMKKILKKLEGKRKKFVKTLSEAETADDVQRTGDLIIANLHNLIPGSTFLEAVDWETDKTIQIPLDPLKSPIDSAKSYFKRAKKLRRAKESVQDLLKQVEQELEYMREVEESVVELEDSKDDEDLNALEEIKEELIQGGYMKPPSDHHLTAKARKKAKKATNPSSGDPDGFRVFTSPNGFRILIGRNSRQNDLISKAKGKEGDLWFHARGAPGAHVLLKLDGKSKDPSEVDIECAAQLAAYFSKMKDERKVTVSMTRAENVTKPKNAPPGLVQITKERSILVRPSDSLAFNSVHP